MGREKTREVSSFRRATCRCSSTPITMPREGSNKKDERESGSGLSFVGGMIVKKKKKEKPLELMIKGELLQDVALPNKAMRKVLATKWNKLTDEEKKTLRAQRAKMGICCPICGSMGYFRETCPNGCVSPPPTPDSMATTPEASPTKNEDDGEFGFGMLWHKPGDEEIDVPIEGGKLDMKSLRPKMLKEKERLRKSDEKVGTFEFFCEADEGYSRTLPELTLHQVLRSLMRLVERQIAKNVATLEDPFDVTLLHPPKEAEKDNFFPEEMRQFKEYKEYFYSYMLKQDKIKTHQFKGQMRPLDSLDVLYRGGNLKDESLYKPDPEAGESQHSKVGWKDPRAQHDHLAVSDPTMLAKTKKMKELFKKQGEWVRLQQKEMMHTNERFEHLLRIIRAEIDMEHKRETQLLHTANAKERRHEDYMVFQERFAAVDRIKETLNLYKFSGALDEADFLVYCMNKWQAKLAESMSAMSNNNSGNNEGPSKRGKKKSSSSAVAGGNMIGRSPYEAENDRIAQSSKSLARTINSWNKGKAKFQTEEEKEEEAQRKLEEERRKEMEELDNEEGENVDNEDEVADSKKKSGKPLTAPSYLSPRSKSKPSLQPLGGVLGGNWSVASGSSFDDNSASSSLSAAHSAFKSRPKESLRQKQRRVGSQLALALADSQSIEEEERKARELAESKIVKRKIWCKVPKKTEMEIDQEAMKQAKTYFRAAGLGSHIRKGNQRDLAYLKPTLIPVPGAFTGDGKDIMISHVANQTIEKIQKSMISDLGYTPQAMLPLYVRSTLVEKNGTSVDGDQTLEVMAKDRRYMHHIGRVLNRFEPDHKLVDPRATVSNDFGPTVKEETEYERKAREAAKRKALRKKREGMMTESLVRMAFGKPPPSLKDLYFRED